MNQGKLEAVKQEMARVNVDILWNEGRDIVQETGIKAIPMEKNCKKAK